MSEDITPPMTVRQRALLALVFIGLAATMFRQVESASLVGDEPGWISSAYLHTAALLEGDLSPERWEFREADVYGNLNPQLGKLMLGLPLTAWQRIAGNDKTFDRYYDFSKSREENIALGNTPPANELCAARIITACYGVLLLWVAMFVVGRAAGWPSGIATGVLFAANPTIVVSTNRAMTDAEYQLFMVALCLPLLSYALARTTRGEVLSAAGVGAMAGLACSVKITGIVLGGLVFLPLLFLKAINPIQEWRRIVAGGLCYAVVALTVVYSLNPFFWPEFNQRSSPDRIAEASTIWDELTAVEYDRSLTEAAYPTAYRLLRPLEFPVLFLRWNSLLERQIAEFTVPPPTLLGYHARLFGEFALFPGDVVFMLIGLTVCAVHLRRRSARGELHPLAVPLCFAVVNYLFWTATTRVELNRYYLSTLIALQLLAGIGVGTIVSTLIRRFQRGRAEA